MIPVDKHDRRSYIAGSWSNTQGIIVHSRSSEPQTAFVHELMHALLVGEGHSESPSNVLHHTLKGSLSTKEIAPSQIAKIRDIHAILAIEGNERTLKFWARRGELT